MKSEKRLGGSSADLKVKNGLDNGIEPAIVRIQEKSFGLIDRTGKPGELIFCAGVTTFFLFFE